MEDDAGDAGTDRHKLDALSRFDPRCIDTDRSDEKYAFVQDTVVPEMVRQAERNSCR